MVSLPYTPNQCCRERGLARGMTLVELMVVIAIVVVLLAALLPSMFQMQKYGRTAATRATVRMLSDACETYMRDFKEYPDSTPTPDMQGRHRLVQSLRGYRDDDGQTGDGWRPGKRGQLYDANYFAINEAPLSDSSPYAFLDAFGNQIVYYAWRGGAYVPGDNDNGPGSADPEGRTYGGPSDVATYAKDKDGNTIFKSFLVISRGYDGSWGSTDGADKLWYHKDSGKINGRLDDVTNFLP